MISSAAEPRPRSQRCGTRAGHRSHRRSHRYRVDYKLLLSIPTADPRCHGGPQFLRACARGPRAAIAEVKLFNVADSIRNGLRSEEKNHHVYFEATEWKEDSTLKVKVTGYGDQNRVGFERGFIADAAKNLSGS